MKGAWERDRDGWIGRCTEGREWPVGGKWHGSEGVERGLRSVQKEIRGLGSVHREDTDQRGCMKKRAKGEHEEEERLTKR